MQITNEFIEQLNSVIAMAIKHGGDVGGPYFCYPNKLFEELQNLVSLMDKSAATYEMAHFKLALKLSMLLIFLYNVITIEK